MQKYEALSLYNVWPFSRIDTMSFAQYREKFLEDMDRVKSELKEVKSLAFRRMMMAEIDRSIPESLFRFAWSKLKMMLTSSNLQNLSIGTIQIIWA